MLAHPTDSFATEPLAPFTAPGGAQPGIPKPWVPPAQSPAVALPTSGPSTHSLGLIRRAQDLLQKHSRDSGCRFLAEPLKDHVKDLRSNDYLGLSRHTRVVEAAAQAVHRFGAGAAASPLVSTRHSLMTGIEDHLRSLLPEDWSILLAGSGYAANATFFEILRLLGSDLAIFIDHRAHASLIAGARTSGLPAYFFSHRDYQALRNKLARCKTEYRVIVVEALHSMEGSFEPLHELADICQNHPGTLVYIDEAHSAGTFGVASWTLASQHNARVLPYLAGIMLGCGKTLGSAGGILCVPRALRDLALQGARPLLYSTAPPPSTLASIHAALGVLADQGVHLSGVLQEHLRRFCMALTSMKTGTLTISNQAQNLFTDTIQKDQPSALQRPSIRVNVHHEASLKGVSYARPKNTEKATAGLSKREYEKASSDTHRIMDKQTRNEPIDQAPLCSPILTLEPVALHPRTATLIQIKDFLLEAGYAVAVIRAPTVPAGREIIRISFGLETGDMNHNSRVCANRHDSLEHQDWPEKLAYQLAEIANLVCKP